MYFLTELSKSPFQMHENSILQKYGERIKVWYILSFFTDTTVVVNIIDKSKVF